MIDINLKLKRELVLDKGLSILTIEILRKGPSLFAFKKTIEDTDVKPFVMGSSGPKKIFSGKNFCMTCDRKNTFKLIFRSFEAF